jgi:hypothetical protein
MKLCILCDQIHGYLKPCATEQSVNRAVLVAAKHGADMRHLAAIWGLAPPPTLEGTKSDA